eukprot:55604-Alexandrium_andersonii.AAC.1
MAGSEERVRSRSARGRSAGGQDFRRCVVYTWRVGDGYCSICLSYNPGRAEVCRGCAAGRGA